MKVYMTNANSEVFRAGEVELVFRGTESEVLAAAEAFDRGMNHNGLDESERRPS